MNTFRVLEIKQSVFEDNNKRTELVRGKLKRRKPFY
jgi:hydrogenase nickel incorporation protein HypB